jgi:phosphatidylserine decarboxylase
VGILLALAVAILLAWKWELELAKVIPAVSLLGVVAGTAVSAVGGGLPVVLRAGTVAVLTIALALGALLFMFLRDPDRIPPDDDDAVVSPADGKVVYVRRAENGSLPVSTKHGRSYPLDALTKSPWAWGDAVVIGIAMNFLDVHVNRAPITGRVTLSRHHAGTFASLKRPESIFENERATTVIAGDTTEIAMVQIASRLVRQIVNMVGEGDKVSLGQRVGMIRFGSQVDVVLPADGHAVLVEVGQRVTAGVSVIARVERMDP